MIKEKILDDMKDLILTLKNKGQELREPYLHSLWSAKWIRVKAALHIASEEDTIWVQDRINKWVAKEIEPYLNDAQKKLLEDQIDIASDEIAELSESDKKKMEEMIDRVEKE